MKGGKSPAGTGGILLLSVLLILSLTLFAVLSLVTARADLRLSEKNASYTAEYYRADAKAEEIAACFSDFTRIGLRPSMESCLKEMEERFPGISFAADERDDGLWLEYRVPMGEGEQVLSVSLSLSVDGKLEKHTWNLLGEQEESEEVPEDSMPLWIGE